MAATLIPKAKGHGHVNHPHQTEATLLDELKSNPDPHSFSRGDKCKVSHIDLSLTLNFEHEKLIGRVILSVEKVDSQTSDLYLDTRHLMIVSVRLIKQDSMSPLAFTHHASVPEFGSKLAIKLPFAVEKNCKVEVKYETSNKPDGFQLFASHNSDHKLLVTHFAPIYARTVLPCQDSPTVKTTFTAQIEAPVHATVLMSAQVKCDPTQSVISPTTHRVHHFNQEIPIPSYLFAIVAGDLVSNQLGPRSHIWTQKEYLKRATEQFSNVEQILVEVENLVGMKYPFGKCDLLVLPPSYCYSGMENPCLIYLNFYQLTGDPSNVNVLAHEVAHQFAGNVVSFANFQHLWISEGLATFIERKIVGKMNKSGEKCRQFAAAVGYRELKASIRAMHPSSALTKLVPDLRGVSPCKALTVVPYEKGHSLLFYLEQQLGGPSAFEPFLCSFIHKYKFQSIKTEDFYDFLIEFYASTGTQVQTQNLKEMDWQKWFYSTGSTPVNMEKLLEKSHMVRCLQLAQDWIQVKDDKLKQPFMLDTFTSLSSTEKRTFLLELTDKTYLKNTSKSLDTNLNRIKLGDIKLQSLTKFYNLKNEQLEVRTAWILLCLKQQWKDVIPEAEKLLRQLGPLCYLRPVYRAMKRWSETIELARRIYLELKPGMGPYSRVEIEEELKDVPEQKETGSPVTAN